MIEITFRDTSEKLWPAACSTFGGPRNSSAQNSAKNVSIAARPSGVRRSPRAASRFSERIVSVWLASSNAVRSSASRAFRISIRNRCLGR